MKTIIDFTNKVKTLVNGRISNIANVEESPSTHPYTVGKQLIFNGLLCKVTSAIAVGDTLAVGTNLTLSDNVVEQIYSLNQGLANSLNNFAPAYSSVSTYAVDNLVTYNGKLYKCIVAVVTPEQFDINKWDDVTTSEVYARTDNSHYYKTLSYNNTKIVPADTTKTHSQFIDAAIASILTSLTNDLSSNQKAIIKSIGYNFTTFVMENNNIISHDSSSFGNIQASSIADDGNFMRIELITKWGSAASDMTMSSIKHSDGTVSYENISASTASNYEFNVKYDVVEYV